MISWLQRFLRGACCRKFSKPRAMMVTVMTVIFFQAWSSILVSDRLSASQKLSVVKPRPNRQQDLIETEAPRSTPLLSDPREEREEGGKRGGDGQWSGGLRAIVTGLEHSGTSITAKILFNAPCVIGTYMYITCTHMCVLVRLCMHIHKYRCICIYMFA